MSLSDSIVFSKKNDIGGFKLNSILANKDIIPISIRTQKGGSLFGKDENLIIPIGLLTSHDNDNQIEGFQNNLYDKDLVIKDNLFVKMQNYL